jgi:hypothetical protein
VKKPSIDTLIFRGAQITAIALAFLILLSCLASCTKAKDCCEIRYETTFYDSNWNILSKDTSFKLGGITCEPEKYLSLDTTCGEFTTGRWVVIKSFNHGK